MRSYHRALKDGTQLSDEHFQAMCHIMQATDEARCEDLLDNPHITEILSRTCLVCHKQFQRKQELLRHLRNHHADTWNQCTHDAAHLESALKPLGTCYCHPPVYARKHLCLLFLQYSMMRLTTTAPPDADVARGLQPDMLLSNEAVVQQLLWLGLPHLLLSRPSLKLAHSLHCQQCNERYRSPQLLLGHLRTDHNQEVEEVAALTRLLTWMLFGDHGCVCNPAVHFGTPDHTCPLHIQIALILRQCDMRITVPWSFKPTDLMDIFDMLLTGPALKRVTWMLLTRQFEQLLLSSEVHQLVSRYCLWCDEAVPLSRALVHLRVRHHFDVSILQSLIQQLAEVAALHHQGHWCSYCNEILPFDQDDGEIVPNPEGHMVSCSYITMVAVMIAHPVWYKTKYQPDVWPTLQQVERVRRSHDLRLMQYNASDSALFTPFGQAFEPLALSGIYMLSDPLFLDDCKFRCLLCNQLFFTSWKFMQHLQAHNFRQLDTQFCYFRLQLRCITPCQFCGLPEHSKQLAGICLTLFNLAVFLSHGPTECLGSGQRYLEPHPDKGPNGRDLGSQGRANSQKAQNRQKPAAEETTEGGQRRSSQDGGQIGPAHGDHHEHVPSGASVPDLHATGSGQHHPCPTSGHTGMASIGQSPSTQTSPHQPVVGNLEEQIGPADKSGTTGSDMARMSAVGDHRCQRESSLPPMGGVVEDAEADYGSTALFAGGGARGGERDPLGTRSHHDSEISLTDQDDRQQRQDTALAVDDQQPKPAGSLAYSAQALLACHLATYPHPNETSISGSEPVGQADPAVDRRTVRILLNPGSICYINAFMIALAWTTVLADAVQDVLWPKGGFELMRSLTTPTCLPLNLALFRPLRWLLSGGWTV